MLFATPQLPPETLVDLAILPPDDDLGPIWPDSDFCRTVENMGVYNPICLKRAAKGYRVVEGKRRVKAARKANHKMIPARIFSENWTDNDIVQIALHENRKANPISELEAFESAIDKGLGINEIKRRTGIKQGRVRVLTKLQNLISELRAAMSDGRLKPSVAHLVAKMPKAEQRKLLPILKQYGRIKVKDVRDIQTVRKNTAVEELPPNLFEDNGDWIIAALAKLGELRAILETRGNFTDLLKSLEKKIRQN